MKQTLFVDYRSYLKEIEGAKNITSVLAFAKQQWEAVGGKVKAHLDIDERTAYLVVQEVPFAITALVREAVDLGPEISCIPAEETTKPEGG